MDEDEETTSSPLAIERCSRTVSVQPTSKPKHRTMAPAQLPDHCTALISLRTPHFCLRSATYPQRFRSQSTVEGPSQTFMRAGRSVACARRSSSSSCRWICPTILMRRRKVRTVHDRARCCVC